MVYITGDTHGNFVRAKRMCWENEISENDILIILGDAGFNLYGYCEDRKKKEYVKELPMTFLCIHGNHEMRPSTLDYYEEMEWRGGIVYVEREFPNILFAKDGEVYDLPMEDGSVKKAIALGGAYSVDKILRISNNWPWFKDEQPSDEIKKRVEEKLDELDWKVDIVLSHTVPEKYIPMDSFKRRIKNVDTSTEQWLGTIEEKLCYEKWYAGHYHCERTVDKLQIMYEEYYKILDKAY